MIPTDEEFLKGVQRIVADVLRIPTDQSMPESRLGDDLDAESLDFVDIQFRLETEYGIELYHGSGIEKLADCLAPQRLEENGLLTSFGAAVLRLRMPELDPARLQEGAPAAGIEGLFTPRTFVRVIKELSTARPEACPNCQSDRLEVAKPSILLCQICGAEIRCPTGEECLEAWANSMGPALQELRKSST